MAFRQVVFSDRVNASIGWVFVGLILLVTTSNFRRGAVLWGGFSLLVGIGAVIPAIARREWSAMVPWPLISLAALAALSRTLGILPEMAGYLALAAFAIMIVVELIRFTTVELTTWFAISFGVMTTLALEAVWIVVQFYSDVWLGTEFLTTQTALQKDIVIVTAVGFAVGGVFLPLFEVFEPRLTTRGSASDAKAR